LTEDLHTLLLPQKPELKLDGHDFSGEYLMVEIMNVPYAGPNLKLAGEADPSDQLLDVVLVSKDEQDKLRDYLRANRQDAAFQPLLRSRRARTIKLTWNGCALHIDDGPWPNKKKKVTPEPTTIHKPATTIFWSSWFHLF
jgi:diacylglycerol kinase (ATP)